MANIVFTNVCNLKCPYCFAEDLRSEEKQEINQEQLINILDWLKPTGSKVNIIGGEPTIHPDFINLTRIMLKYSQITQENAVTLFTNGIKLGDLIVNNRGVFDNPKLFILLNYNNPSNMTKEQQKELAKSMQVCMDSAYFKNKKITLGCNIFPVDDYSYYDYFWEAVEKYKVQVIRVSEVSPCGQFACYKNNKDEYFERIKPIFLRFCKDIKKHKCDVVMDCGYIPRCYFTEEELQIVVNAGFNLQYFERSCVQPVMDISPNGDVISCFGGKDNVVNIYDFTNANSLKTYFTLYNRNRLYNSNPYEKCTHCHDFIAEKCQGGCLGFLNQSKN